MTDLSKIRNLTPHAVTINGITFPPSGTVARVDIFRHPAGTIYTEAGEIPTYTTAFGQVTDLPDRDGGLFIVSSMVRTHPDVAHRVDVASPGNLVRNFQNEVIGCEGLDFNY